MSKDSNVNILAVYLSIFFLLQICACGQAPNTESGRGNTGGYRANLVFPEDIPRPEDSAKALGGFSCGERGIATIEFNFILNGHQYSSPPFDCDDHHASISDVPAGKGVTVEVFADDGNGEAVYEGSEVVNIQRDQVTTGGPVQMRYATFTNDFGMDFVRIPAANQPFMMGSPTDELGRANNETQHQVTLSKDYYMQVTEVTQGQWREVLETAGVADSTIPHNPSSNSKCGDDCPVDQISWDEIQQFITALRQLDKVDYILPSEAQWEYAARGGSTTALPNGNLTVEDCNLDDNLNRIAWYCGNSENRMHSVGGKEPNAYGLYDMLGNVWEWCQDWYDAYPTDSVTDPHGPSSGGARVLRGGYYAQHAMYCRSAYRNMYQPGGGVFGFGFRLTTPLFSR